MSDSDDKQDGKAADPKTTGSKRPKPLKRSRKRQASRPPTIDVKAVRLQDEAKKETVSEDTKPDEPTPPKAKPEEVLKTEPREQFGYRALALSAGVGAAAAILLFAGVFGVSVFSSDQENMTGKIEELSGKIETMNTLVTKSTVGQDNTKEIVSLKQQLQDLAKRPDDPRLEKINQQIKSIELELAKPRAPTIKTADLKNLSDRLNALTTTTREVKSSAEKSIQRSVLLEKALKAAGETIKGANDGTQGSLIAQNLRLADFENQIKLVTGNLEKLQKIVTTNTPSTEYESTIAEIQEEARQLKDKIATLDNLNAQATTAMMKATEAASKIDQRITSLEQSDRSEDTGRLAAVSFAIEGLIKKIENGGGFEHELSIVTAALQPNENLNSLKKIAPTGIKSIAQLQAEFPPVLKSILNADEAQPATGVVAKIVGSAKSLIKIRRIGEIEGNSREAIIARLEARVKAGDLAAALIAAKKLEGASVEVAKDWVQALEERLKTIELIKNIRNDVISNLELNTASSATKE